MNDLELRYPFGSAFDFFRSGFWLEAAAFPLLIGWFFLLAFVIIILKTNLSFVGKMAVLFFCLAIFNNPGYRLFFLAPNEFFGVIGSISFLFKLISSGGLDRVQPLVKTLIFSAILMSAHAFLILFLIYPELVNIGFARDMDVEGIWLLRVSVIGRVYVFSLMVWALLNVFKNDAQINQFIRLACISVGLACGVYLLQMIMFLAGVVPYGTFLDAGFSGFPCFGGTSVERGHFGKFLTPMFPLLLLAYMRGEKKWIWIPFILVTIINLSASSQAFFYFYLLLTIVFLGVGALKARVFVGVGVFVIMFASLYAFIGPSGFIGVFDKLLALGDSSDGVSDGGRSFSGFTSFIQAYPWGIGYGGSFFRYVDTFYTDVGIYAFFVQLSLVALIVIAAAFYVIFNLLGRARSKLNVTEYAILKISILGMVFIFSADILWFVPTVWLCFVLLYATVVNRERISVRLPAKHHISINNNIMKGKL